MIQPLPPMRAAGHAQGTSHIICVRCLPVLYMKTVAFYENMNIKYLLCYVISLFLSLLPLKEKTEAYEITVLSVSPSFFVSLPTTFEPSARF
jgi:hypothetical protein